MNQGFFSTSETQGREPISLLPHCGSCGLYKTCKSPKMPVTGKGKKRILIVAEAPGQLEDERNTQLIGKAGKHLRMFCEQNGLDLDKDCWKTNAVICRPPENKTPNDDIIIACRPNLLGTVKELKPNVIVLLGAVALKSYLSTLWKDSIGSISQWVGWSIPCRNPNTWIIPTYHPSYLMRANDVVLDKMFDRHIHLAVKKAKARPWEEIPNYEEQIERIYRPSQAVMLLKELELRYPETIPVAFDYETNCLKPDGDGPEIVSCSVCFGGKRTISFLWQESTADAMSELLRSPHPKIAANLKFEERWTMRFLGHRVRNWFWDTIVAAHVLDARPDITNLKFQAFVNLGMESYDRHIEPFLKSAKGERFNRIREVDVRDLLLYGGLDSLCTYKIAMRQIKQMAKRNDTRN